MYTIWLAMHGQTQLRLGEAVGKASLGVFGIYDYNLVMRHVLSTQFFWALLWVLKIRCLGTTIPGLRF